MATAAKILGPDGKPFRVANSQQGLAARRDIASRYDAAITNTENANHWANADGLSAKEANSPEVRRILRNRARQERDNNTYCSGMAETLANDTIGTGPRLQLRTPDRGLNRRVADAFEEWTAAIGLAEKLRTYREARCIDGEAFLLLASNPAVPTAVQLDLDGVECDRVSTPDLWFDDPRRADGIVFDAYGNPVEYHLLKRHPGDLGSFGTAWGEYERVPASLVLHWFKRRRPGQVRGVPEVTPALPLYALLRRYTLATVSSAEVAALFAVLLKTTMPPDDETPAVTPFDTQELVRGMIAALPEGYEAQQMKPEHPATTFDMFEAALIRQIARCLNMPFNVASGNSSGYNYASGRLDHQVYHRAIGVDRYFLETHVLDRVLRAWIEEARLADPALVAGLEPGRLPRHRWDWDGFRHVDPSKEAAAQAQRLANGTTTLEIECAEDGNDWRDVADQREAEAAYHAEKGLPYPGHQASPAPPPDSPEDIAEAIAMNYPSLVRANSAPSTLSIAAAGPAEILAARGGDQPRRPRFSILGYTGATMRVAGFYTPVVLDLDGGRADRQEIPALRDHDPARIVGQTSSVSITPDGGARMEGEFAGVRVMPDDTVSGDNEDARQVVSLGRDDFRWQASVGAEIIRQESVKAGESARVNGREVIGPILIAREWRLKEISFVALGADSQTSGDVAATDSNPGSDQRRNPVNFDDWVKAKGFDPAALTDQQKTALRAMFDADRGRNNDGASTHDAGGGNGNGGGAVQAAGATATAVPVAAAAPAGPQSPHQAQTLDQIVAAQRAEDERVRQITAITASAIQRRPVMLDEFEMMARAAIEKKTTVTEFELVMLRREREAPSGGSFAIHATERRGGPEAIEAAVCRSAGLKDPEKHFGDQALTAADRQFRHGLGLKQLLMLAARENGRPDVSPNDVRGLLEASFVRASSGFSTFSLSGILSNAANKFVVEAFNAVEMAWRQIASTRPVSDFKAITSYSLTGDLMYEQLGAAGEIKHGTIGELSYTNQADTYAKMLAITRKDIINDDLGVFNQVPRRLGRGAALKINDVFWTTFLAGVGSFWTSGRNNLVTGGGTALSSAGLSTATTTFKQQTDPDGKPLAAMPAILLTPTELEITGDELMTSTVVNTGGSSTTDQVPNANVWRSKYRHVSSVYLSNSSYTGYSTTAWYLLADPNDIPTIEVAFLNGREMPMVESADADFNTLGIQFRGVHDFGCALMEYRGSVRAAGT